MRLKLLGSVLFVAVFMVSVIVHLPAAFVLKHVPLPRALQIDGVSGSLWKGRATQVHWHNQGFGALSWRMNTVALLTGRIEADIRIGRGSAMQLHGRGVVGYGLDGVYANNVIASLPASQILQYSPQPLPVAVKGQVELSLKQFQYAQPWCQSAKGSLVWSKASLETPASPLQLDQVLAQVDCLDNNLSIEGQQKSAQVSSEFSATVYKAYHYKVTSWFHPEAQFPAELGQWLDRLPTPDSKGRYHFSPSGQL
ncbi:type II secretion system protein N [Vibrio zhugei]|uniref:Type II secretion system protein N n=1 Tax=Vibrio zhugei TaxID=2479546 RepID=A0ABV7C886_9VIBR|nr:type II secretion system protein N [Vibrio zhugei]